MSTHGADPFTLDQAATLLRAGGICAFPTETVYGLAADATNADAVLKVYEAKGRPRFNPLIVHCADRAMAGQIAEFSDLADRLAILWPGPLSLVLPLRADARVCDIVTAGLDTVAVRLPAHPVARELIGAVGRPLAAPSANPSGRLSPTTAGQVRRAFAGRIPVLDGGPCQKGLESTIIAVADGRLIQLRAGAMPREEIEYALGIPVEISAPGSPVAAPGMLRSHYAPNAALRLDAARPEPGEAFLAFGPPPSGVTGQVVNLSRSGDLHEAARNLFGCLHELDAAGAPRIAVAPIPLNGLGEAINDRLRRAAAPREE